MHSIVRNIHSTGDTYDVVFVEPVSVGEVRHVENRLIGTFMDIDSASHLCNRLNGGQSSEVSVFLEMYVRERLNG